MPLYDIYMTHHTYYTSKEVIFLPNVLSLGCLIMSSKIVFSELGVSLMCEPEVNISQIVCRTYVMSHVCLVHLTLAVAQ